MSYTLTLPNRLMSANVMVMSAGAGGPAGAGTASGRVYPSYDESCTNPTYRARKRQHIHGEALVRDLVS